MDILSLAPACARAAYDGHTPRGYMKSYLRMSYSEMPLSDVGVFGCIWAVIGTRRKLTNAE